MGGGGGGWWWWEVREGMMCVCGDLDGFGKGDFKKEKI